MGDFVDRGFYSVETFLLLLALKVRIPLFSFIVSSEGENSIVFYELLALQNFV
jgi:hypothetical protein